MMLLLVGWAAISGAQTTVKPLTNADVIAMTRKGMSVAEISNVLKSSPTNFDISYPAMLELQKAGVDPVIGNLMMQLTVNKTVMSQMKGKTTIDMPLPPGDPPPTGGKKGSGGNKQQIKIDQAIMMTDDDFQAQQDKGMQILAEHGCFGPEGPKIVLQGGKTMFCQGVSSNMAPGSSAKISGATTAMSSGFLIGGEHAVMKVPASAVFEANLGDVPGVNMADFKPLLVKLASSPTGRIVSKTRMTVTAKFPVVRFETDLQDDVVPAAITFDTLKAMESANMCFVIKPLAPLPPGEYGIVLRRGGSPNMHIKDGKNDPAMGMVQAVWDFSVVP